LLELLKPIQIGICFGKIPTEIDLLWFFRRNVILGPSIEEKVNDSSVLSSQLNSSRNWRMYKSKNTISGRLKNCGRDCILHIDVFCRVLS
jgi:hypothetical protein